MAYLLDTNVVSEAASRNPESKVVEWCEAHSHDSHLSCITLGEIWKGIHLMPEGKRKISLGAWATRLETESSNPSLPLDAETFKIWGKLYAKHESEGFNLGMLDSLLAATALRHGLIVVTRNTADFPPDVATINPWLG
jgi:predicted nucleic acid-binding protein